MKKLFALLLVAAMVCASVPGVAANIISPADVDLSTRSETLGGLSLQVPACLEESYREDHDADGHSFVQYDFSDGGKVCGTMLLYAAPSDFTSDEEKIIVDEALEDDSAVVFSDVWQSGGHYAGRNQSLDSDLAPNDFFIAFADGCVLYGVLGFFSPDYVLLSSEISKIISESVVPAPES